MTVLYISHYSELNGAPRSLVEFIISNKENVIPIVVVPNEGTLCKKLRELNICVVVVPFELDMVCIGKKDNESFSKIFISEFNAAKKICTIIKKKNVDLVHTNTSVTNVGVYTALMLGVPHVWHIREWLEEDFANQYSDKKWKEILFKASKLITISKCIEKNISQKYSVGSMQIYNGILTKRYLAKISIKKNHNILVAGTISEKKGQWDVLLAVHKLFSIYPDINLYLVGAIDKIERWYYEQYIRENNLHNNVFILEFIDDLCELREKCMISITSSKMEALGRVTIEAMLAGNLVIGANTGGTLELIGDDGNRGFLYDVGDSVNLAQVIDHVYSLSSDEIKVVLSNAQNFAIENFDVKLYKEKVNNLYKNAIRDYQDDSVLLKKIEDRFEQLTNMNKLKCCDARENQFIHNIEYIWQKKGNLGSLLTHREIKNVVIYGMGYWGVHLYEDFINSGLNVLGVIDQGIGGKRVKTFLKVYNKGEIISDADIIIVSVLRDENEIINDLKNYYNNVLGITELVNEEYNILFKNNKR